MDNEDEGSDPTKDYTVEELLDMQARVQEAGGVVAIEDELVCEDLIRPGPKRFVKATKVAVEG